MPDDPGGFAPAKINLTLHITGRRTDGYHLLDSLVVFADVGDVITAEPADETSLEIDGPFAHRLDDGADNLVRLAAALFGDAVSARLRLTKNLPVASGIGGGSADAAATVRLIMNEWDLPLPPMDRAVALGADVPVCLASRTCRMSGIGEQIEFLELPEFWVVLVNPGVPVSTGMIFHNLSSPDNPGMPDLPDIQSVAGLCAYLAGTRNDLEPVAIDLEPTIGDVIAVLTARPGCRFVRMSGSGATVFGIFETANAANIAAAAISAEEPGWWVCAANVPPSGDSPPVFGRA